MNRFSGKVALITGAGTGIGRACAERFAREGAAVIAGVEDHAQAQGLAAAQVHAFDVTCENAWARVVGEIARSQGGLDILVNNAGVHLAADVLETGRSDWDRVMNVNLYGCFLGCRAAIPAMRRRGGGAIVTIASFAAHRGVKRQVAYAASKGGVLAMTLALAADHAPDGIRVNCVCPAATDTPIIARFADGQPDRDAFLKGLSAVSPLGRMARPAEVAAAVAFLASDDASYLTGVALPVDGGRSG